MKRWILSLLVGGLAFGLSTPLHAKTKKQRKRGRVATSIQEAMARSQSDYENLRERVDEDNERRLEEMEESRPTAIHIDVSEPSHFRSDSMPRSGFSPSSFGEDQSGLDTLRSPVVDEPIETDFDEELRDVSSFTD